MENRINPIVLSVDEKQFLLRFLKEHLDYYRILSGSTKVSPGNRDKAKFIETLYGKLTAYES